MKKRRRLKKKVKIFLITIVLILISSLSLSILISYARYTSEANDSDEIRVAKTGTLTLVEKLNGEVQENNSDSLNIIESVFSLGENINKEVYIEFTNSEVSTYLFLVIDSENWEYNDETKEFSVLNNNSKLLSFNINNNWIYLENLSNQNKFIFYHELDVTSDTSTKFDVMNQINTGMIGYNDIEILNNSQIKFNAYSIQKNDDLSIEESWEYLNI